jgi:hypothetical protein
VRRSLRLVCSLAVAAAAPIALGGCLTFERASWRMTVDRQDLATYEFTFVNIRSDDSTAAGQTRDFEELIAVWRNDDYLVDAIEQGRYVKSRALAVENGMLVGRETGVRRMTPIMDVPDLTRGPDGVVRARVKRDEYVSSNGTFVPDSEFVRWPKDAREFRVEAKAATFRGFGDFAGRFLLRRDAK